mmetsp:Transcript_17181/g.42138  ORF Transcript_17181/g.42138 Transcript_17181/m.42138 type:complete len:103 (-) Transcript_17181:160-468(-)
MGTKPDWFRSIVWFEILLQLPFFFLATWVLRDKKEDTIAAGFIAYSAHVVTTMIPILGTFVSSRTFKSEAQRYILIGIYLPYLLFPLAILFHFLQATKCAPL